jgi:hypothetical protein
MNRTAHLRGGQRNKTQNNMVDKNQIPYLLQLIDDDSPEVRQHVAEKLLALGPELERELSRFAGDLSSTQVDLLRNLMTDQREAARRREAWLQWPGLPAETDRLERAFELMAEFQYDWMPPVKLGELLDDIADEFGRSGRPMDPLGLSRFLFITKKYRGNVDDYYNPLNSNLIHVIQSRRGIPITLTCLFILVGARLGLRIHGCNVPTHFLARADLDGELLLFDCFNRGRVLTKSEMAQLRNALAPQFEQLITDPPSAEAIVVRVLRNLVSAYEMADLKEKMELTLALLRDLTGDDPAVEP